MDATQWRDTVTEWSTDITYDCQWNKNCTTHWASLLSFTDAKRGTCASGMSRSSTGRFFAPYLESRCWIISPNPDILDLVDPTSIESMPIKIQIQQSVRVIFMQQRCIPRRQCTGRWYVAEDIKGDPRNGTKTQSRIFSTGTRSDQRNERWESFCKLRRSLASKKKNDYSKRTMLQCIFGIGNNDRLPMTPLLQILRVQT